MCRQVTESIAHLYFQCHFSAQIWGKVLQLLQIDRRAACFSCELAWAMRYSKRCTGKHKVYLMFFIECIYAVWIQRNDLIFNQNGRNIEAIFKDICFKVASRCSIDHRNLLLDLFFS